MIIPFPYIILISEYAFKEEPILDSAQRKRRIGVNPKLFTKRNG